MPSYVFNEKRQVPSGQRCSPMQVYQLDESDVVGMPAEEVKPTGEKVGSALANIFQSLGIQSGSRCTCESLKQFLNQVDLAWCKRHEDEIVNAIAINAAALGYPAIKVIIRRFVRMAIRQEQKHAK